MKGPQSRLVKRLGFCAALALIALVAIPLQLASDSLSDESVDRVSEVSAITASSVALQINSLSSAVDGFSRRGDVGTWLTARQGDGQGELEELRLSNGSIRSVALIDAAGRVVMTEPYNPMHSISRWPTATTSRLLSQATQPTSRPCFSDVLATTSCLPSRALSATRMAALSVSSSFPSM